MRGSAALRTSVSPGGALAGPWVRDELWRRARAVPSLDLRFADNKSLVDATTGQNLVTFTRASSGTYVDSQGVLQTAVTNLLLRSEEFQTTWTTNNASITSDSTAAPNGTVTADTLVEDNATAVHLVTQSVTITSLATHTFSVFIKASTRTRARIAFLVGADGARADFNLSTGTVTSSAAVGSGTLVGASIQDIGGGWYRCIVTGSGSAGTTGSPRVELLDASGNRTYAGDNTSGLFLWGAQLEQSSTVGEYIPTTSTINSAPRFDHNPTTGESLGLLVEEQRTNLCLQSNGFDTTWTNTESVETGNQIMAPDGTNTGWKLVNNTVNQNHNIFQGIAWSAVATTASLFVKYLDHRWVGIRIGAAGNQFFGSWDLQNGVVGSATTGATIGIQPYANGWHRLTITATLTAAGSTNLIIGLNNADATALTSYAGTGTGVYLFGCQLEVGAFPTSYIPTGASAATRAADVCSISGSNFSSWYRQDEGTVFAEYQQYATGGTAVNISDNTGSNFINIFTSAAANARGSANVFVSGTNNGRIDSGGTFAANSNTRTAYGLSAGSRSFSAQGNTVSTSASPATLPTVNRMYVGVNQDVSGGWNNGTIRRLVYWGQRLPNNVLQAITQ